MMSGCNCECKGRDWMLVAVVGVVVAYALDAMGNCGEVKLKPAYSCAGVP